MVVFQIARQASSAIFWMIANKPYEVSLDIVQRTLRLVQKELDLDDDQELKTMAMDVLCLEATGIIQMRGP